MSANRSDHVSWARLKRRYPDLLARIRSSGNVRLELTRAGAPQLESYAAARPDVRAALAEREAELRLRFEHGASRDEREAARVILQRDFAWRDPPARTVAEEFGEILTEFAAADPDGYSRLHAILSRRDSSAAERRRKHAAQPIGGA